MPVCVTACKFTYWLAGATCKYASHMLSVGSCVGCHPIALRAAPLEFGLRHVADFVASKCTMKCNG